jgi:hypothetical protein
VRLVRFDRVLLVASGGRAVAGEAVRTSEASRSRATADDDNAAWHQSKGRARALSSVIAGAGVLVALIMVAPPVHAQPPLGAQNVTVTVTDVSPTTPAYTDKPQPLTIMLSLTNTTDRSLYNVVIDVERDQPVTSQTRLEQLIAKPAPTPSDNVLSPLPNIATRTLGPNETRILPYKTTTSLHTGTGICLCFVTGGGVYPINFTVSAAPDPDANTTQVGFGQTYIPAFKDKPKPVHVSWVWPLIDRPHRLLDGKTFLDDDLASSVSPGGRLYRALDVVQNVAPSVHLTLLIDPELVDELATMSQPYLVESDGKTTPGTGTAAAKAWLARLKSVVTSTQVSLTPYADPEITSLSRAGLGWSDSFSPSQQLHLTGYLGIPPSSDVVWPPGGTITSDALRQVLKHRTRSVVVLSDAALPGARETTPRRDALATLPSQYGPPRSLAAVTDSAVQRLVARTLRPDGSGAAALPELASELAVRAAEQPSHPHYVVITADRYVNVQPQLAERALRATAAASWSTSLTLEYAARTVLPVDHGQLVEPTNQPQLPSANVTAAVQATQFMNAFGSALNSSDAPIVIGGLPAAIQRTESAAWVAEPARGIEFAGRLDALVGAIQRGVYISRPSSGTYTLASNDAPLPITVVNTLPVDVHIRVRVSTANDVAGFHADDTRVVTIPRAASSTSPTRDTLKISTRVQRAGTFQVNAVLLTPDGTELGSSVPLSIHSTALGAIGVIITAVAVGVLVLALAIRVVRRVRGRTKRPAQPAEPAPIGAGA